MRKEAPPALRHALCAVHERLDLYPRRLRDPRRLGKSAFAREHHARRTLRLEEVGGGRIGATHLRRDVERHAMLLAESDHAPVRDDERVGVGLCEGNHVIHRTQLILKHDRVEDEVEFHATLPTPARSLRQLVAREVSGRPRAHVERLEAEINRVRPRVERGLKARHVPRRRKDFGFLHGLTRG